MTKTDELIARGEKVLENGTTLEKLELLSECLTELENLWEKAVEKLDKH